MNKLTGMLSALVISTLQLSVAHAASKLADYPILSQQSKTYKITNIHLNDNYIRLTDVKTGTNYNTDPKVKLCSFWNDKPVGTVLKMVKVIRQMPGNATYPELTHKSMDASCGGVYFSRTQDGG